MSEFWSQMARFWSFEDRAVQTAVAGVALLGLSCGSLGCFVVLRRLSLVGDSLGHAVLPGVCIGFLATWTKDPLWIFAGALAAALAASWLMGVVQRNSRLKPDVAMGLVLSGFFGLGVVLLTRLQNFSAGNQSGLNQFLFGQASAINERDLWLAGPLSLAIVATIALFFKELAVSSFDEAFAATIGLKTQWIHYLLMTLTATAIVISIQAVGVVLLSALIIMPAATALLLTNRLRSMVLLAAGLAALGGVIGVNLSFLGRRLPTGPLIVVTLAVFFALAWLVSPQYGWLVARVRQIRRARRVQRENLLKQVFRAVGEGAAVPLDRLAAELGQSPASVPARLRPLAAEGWIELDRDRVELTASGRRRAGELERNYRLWELFLTHEIDLPLDHVERDAEDIEHILGPDLVRQLEEKYAGSATTRPERRTPPLSKGGQGG